MYVLHRCPTLSGYVSGCWRLTGYVTGVTGRPGTQRDEQDKFKSISASIFQVVLLQGGLFRQVTLYLFISPSISMGVRLSD